MELHVKLRLNAQLTSCINANKKENKMMSGQGSDLADVIVEHARKASKHLKWVGLAMILLGMFAIVMPHTATLAIEDIIAASLIAGGFFLGLEVSRYENKDGMLLRFVGMIVYILAGVLIIAYPMQGEVTLTLILAILFTVAGVMRCMLALQLRPIHGWAYVAASGAADLVLGVFLWADLPASAFWALGLIVGVDLLFAGWTVLVLAKGLKKAGRL